MHLNGQTTIGLSGTDNWLGTLFGCDAINGNNFSKWCNTDFDTLITAAKNTTDVGERTKLYEQAQKLLKEQVPLTPIAHSTVYQPMRKNVEGFKISPLGLMSFYGVSVDK